MLLFSLTEVAWQWVVMNYKVHTYHNGDAEAMYERFKERLGVCVFVCFKGACVRACVRACARPCVYVHARVYVRLCVLLEDI